MGINPVIAFIEETCDLDDDEAIEVQELYSEYRSWCKEAGHRPVARMRFSNQVLAGFSPITKKPYGGNRRLHFVGLGRKPSLS